MEYLATLKIFSWRRIELSLLYINQVWLMKQSQHASIAQGEKPPEHKVEQQMPSKFCRREQEALDAASVGFVELLGVLVPQQVCFASSLPHFSLKQVGNFQTIAKKEKKKKYSGCSKVWYYSIS